MPDTAAMTLLERRLVELGCPRRWLRDKVRELADHHDDLKQAALDDGLPEQEAVARADAQLGDPVALAENAAALLRLSSWWGRHRIIGFCALPPLAFGPAWLGCALILAGFFRLLGWLCGPAYDFLSPAHALADDPDAFRALAAPVNAVLNFSALLASGLMFYWLIRRSAAGTKWIWVALGACALNGLFTSAGIGPRAVFIGYSAMPVNWTYATAPLLVAVAAFLRQRKLENRLPPIPKERRLKLRRQNAKLAPTLRLIYRTPTYWLVVILIVSLTTLIAHERGREDDLKFKIWPSERAATLAQIKARQSADVAAANETMIALAPWQNATLLDSTDGPDEVKGNNLAELPAGVQVFGGVRFDVEGKIQLLGERLPRFHRKLPVRINGIVIGRKCERLHLLHGASFLRERGKKIASLVLHYADGSQADLGIIAGEHVLDWWGPIYNTDAGDERETSMPGTELAWSGGNPRIKQRSPEFSLRLYKSTFANPHPELAVTSLDYVSTLEGPAPFLVGLTIEQSPSTAKLP